MPLPVFPMASAIVWSQDLDCRGGEERGVGLRTGKVRAGPAKCPDDIGCRGGKAPPVHRHPWRANHPGSRILPMRIAGVVRSLVLIPTVSLTLSFAPRSGAAQQARPSAGAPPRR